MTHKNLFLRAYERVNSLEIQDVETADLIRELDKNRMALVRCIEMIVDDPGIYDFPEISETWLEYAATLVFESRNNVK